jgi:hypothetical protein
MSRAVFSAIAILAVLVLGAAAPLGAGITDEDYAPFEARITDTQGVVTELESFGYATGPNVLLAHLGDGDVDVPLRRVRSLEIGALVEKTRRAPVRATMRSGKVYALELDNSELTRLLYGDCEIGEFRIRLAKVRRLDVLVVEGETRP